MAGFWVEDMSKVMGEVTGDLTLRDLSIERLSW